MGVDETFGLMALPKIDLYLSELFLKSYDLQQFRKIIFSFAFLAKLYMYFKVIRFGLYTGVSIKNILRFATNITRFLFVPES